MNRKPILLLIVALLVCFALPAGLAAEPGDTDALDAVSFIPGEPNDTFAAATPIELASHLIQDAYFLTAADLDYYRFTIAGAARIDVTAYLSSEYDPTPLRLEMAIYDANQVLLAADTDCGDPAALSVPLPAGAFFARLKPCAGTLDIDRRYQMQVTQQRIDWEPNNTQATAQATANVTPDYVNGAVAPAGDIDFYRLEAAAGESIYFDLAPDEALAPHMALLNAAGTELVVAAYGCAGDPYTYCLSYLTPAAGPYYLRVRSAAYPSGGGAYTLSRQAMSIGEVEPNNLPAQATTIGYGAHFDGLVSPADPIDYFKFTGQAGDGVAFGNHDWNVSWGALNGVALTLYGPTMNPLPMTETQGVNWVVLPAGGVYTLKVAILATQTEAVSYPAFITRLAGDEPENNLMAGAIPAAVGQIITGRFDYLCDEDWYSLQGRAGDVFPIDYPTSPFWQLYDAAGNLLPDTVVLPADGTYYLKVRGIFNDNGLSWCNIAGPYRQTAGSALWLSSDLDALGGDRTLKQHDIVTRDAAAGKWQLVFDASDVGITQDVTAFEALPNGSILMSLDAGQNVPGLGLVDPQDIIRFVPTALGATTTGAFQWYLDGSDVGLTTADEKIDAIYLKPSQWDPAPLRVSTFGPGSAPGEGGGALNFEDEDLINFIGAQYGATSAGVWRMDFDGSTIPGLAAEDLNAVARVELNQDEDSPSLMVMRDSFNLSGVKGNARDVLSDRPAWRLVIKSFANKNIDGLAVGP